MQTELNAEYPNLAIQIFGVNQTGYTSGNSTVIQLGDVPWLQDNAQDNVWGAWDPTYRDVIILDEQNQPVGVFNLTINNLSQTSDFEALKSLLVTEAQN